MGGLLADSLALVTLGCRVGRADAGSIAASLPDGFRAAAPGEAADWVVVSTCSVTADAASTSRQAVRRAAREHPGARIVVAGCHVEQEGELLAALPGVAAVVGPRDHRALPGLLASLREGVGRRGGARPGTTVCARMGCGPGVGGGCGPPGDQGPGRVRRRVRLLRRASGPGRLAIASPGGMPGPPLLPRQGARRGRPLRRPPGRVGARPRPAALARRPAARRGQNARHPAHPALVGRADGLPGRGPLRGRRRRHSASTSTSRSRAVPTGCSGRWGAPIAPPDTPPSWRAWSGHGPAPPSAPT